MIYLDYAANTPASEEVLKRYVDTERKYIANANSLHKAGDMAREELEQITDHMAELLGVLSEELIYTSGASESNNTAIKGLVEKYGQEKKHIIATPLEHSSVVSCLEYLEQRGYVIDYVNLTKEGTVDLEHLKHLLEQETCLVVVSAVDSEIGTIQPIEEISSLVKEKEGCFLHIDGTQAVGKIPVDFTLGDTMSLAPHKFHGLNGSGMLIKRKGVELEPLIHGGHSASPYRSGTAPIGLIAGMDQAVTMAIQGQKAHYEYVKKRNAYLREKLQEYPQVGINTPQTGSPYILNLCVNGVRGVMFQKALSSRDVCVSVKSACSQAGAPSKAVMAMLHDRRAALSSWRISLSYITTQEEIEAFLTIFDQCYKELVRK